MPFCSVVGSLWMSGRIFERRVRCTAGASEPRNLGYMERLGLWGPGNTAFPDFAAFLSAIGSRGVAALELVAMDLKAQGVYVARTLSYSGVIPPIPPQARFMGPPACPPLSHCCCHALDITSTAHQQRQPSCCSLSTYNASLCVSSKESCLSNLPSGGEVQRLGSMGWTSTWVAEGGNCQSGRGGV